MKRLFIVLAIVVATGASLVWGGWWSKEPKTPDIDARMLSWEDLIPEGWVPPENPLNNMTQDQINKLLDGSDESNREIAEIEELLNFAPVEPSLDGQMVSLPGYIVPLEFDEATEVNEFLLVPYMGACIHTPPPPANQVVFANSEKTVKLVSMYDAVVITGTMKTETVEKDIAEAGYTMEVQRVEPYQEPEENTLPE